MLGRKSVKQRFVPSQHLLKTMDVFRQSVNECVRIGLESGRSSMKALSLECYPKLRDWPLGSQYKLCAISKASGILKNYRKLSKKRAIRRPFCTKPILTTCYGLKVIDCKLTMPNGLSVPLNNHTLGVLSDPSLEIRSVVLGPNTLSISVQKKTDEMEQTGLLGLDRNVDNITLADTDGNAIRYDLKEATEEKGRCRQTKRKFTRNDSRIRRLVYGKYGTLQRNRVSWLLHNVSARIVRHAKENGMAIAMEDIKGIRKLYQKGNGQGKNYRAAMNSWSYFELQRQIDYKARWEGIAVYYVSPRGTSARCSECGDKMFPEGNRVLKCHSCGLTIDRDFNAARNILKAGLRFSPVGPPVEAVKGNETQTPILIVDGGKPGERGYDAPTTGQNRKRLFTHPE